VVDGMRRPASERGRPEAPQWLHGNFQPTPDHKETDLEALYFTGERLHDEDHRLGSRRSSLALLRARP
jgi:hypothetical protein